MSIVAERVSEISLGEFQKHRNLTMIPLLAGGPDEPEYQLLDDAISSGNARVTEVSESGSVPELRFINEGDRPVLLLDGEELVGAKQNRILNLTVLAAANTTVVIPVSCVEAGRWRLQSREFSSAKRAHYATGRARKAAQVNESLRSAGTRWSDQGEIWRDISAKADRLKARSETEAAAAMYDTHRASLEDFLRTFHAVDGQSGAMFAINGQILGFDIFDSPTTFPKIFPKLVESFALDAIDGEMEEKGVSVEGVKAFLNDTSNTTEERFPAVGEGEDHRLQGNGLGGGALVHRERVVHLCAFKLSETLEEELKARGRMLRASMRRRGLA